MVSTLGWLYLAAGTILFFFWAYGIVSFALDVKKLYLPAVRTYLDNRRARAEEEEQEREAEQRRRQLF